ncbi:hypothetical protein AX17_002058 [Amanita inopinata Kibby_2008]|nr:hypothetical protein AX17_002058 [Amanita inopinata Kibby_2008]
MATQVTYTLVATIAIIFSFLSISTFAAPLAPMLLSDLPYNFTLSAWNTTLPNANSTGVPLVLGQNGASAGLSFQVTATFASYPYNDFPILGLVDGSLRAYRASGFWMTNATAVHSGGSFGWVSSTFYSRPATRDFTVVRAPAYQYPVLAVNGREDLWSLCPFRGFRGQTEVLFNVSADGMMPHTILGFDPEECYETRIHVITASE